MKRAFILIASIFSFCHKRDKRERIAHSYSEIDETVNNLSTTWKARSYDRNFKPSLGSISEGLDYLQNNLNQHMMTFLIITI